MTTVKSKDTEVQIAGFRRPPPKHTHTKLYMHTLTYRHRCSPGDIVCTHMVAGIRSHI